MFIKQFNFYFEFFGPSKMPGLANFFKKIPGQVHFQRTASSRGRFPIHSSWPRSGAGAGSDSCQCRVWRPGAEIILGCSSAIARSWVCRCTLIYDNFNESFFYLLRSWVLSYQNNHFKRLVFWVQFKLTKNVVQRVQDNANVRKTRSLKLLFSQ